MSGLSHGTDLWNMKVVSLTVLEQLPFKAQKFRGHVALATPPFQKILRDHVRTVPRNRLVKFEVCSFQCMSFSHTYPRCNICCNWHILDNIEQWCLKNLSSVFRNGVQSRFGVFDMMGPQNNVKNADNRNFWYDPDFVTFWPQLTSFQGLFFVNHIWSIEGFKTHNMSARWLW